MKIDFKKGITFIIVYKNVFTIQTNLQCCLHHFIYKFYKKKEI